MVVALVVVVVFVVKLKFDQDFKACGSFCFEIKLLKVLNFLGSLCL